jgi:hypothetical protein
VLHGSGREIIRDITLALVLKVGGKPQKPVIVTAIAQSKFVNTS